MSDFDKEAEREKLRKKYEQDQREREATKRMSDLLLKGARMTNTHCDTCGDPLFEQNGVTFCPTCHGGPEGVEASIEGEDAESGTADGAEGEDADGATSEGVAAAADGDEQAPVAGESGDPESDTSPDADPELEVRAADDRPDGADEPRSRDRSPERPRDGSRSPAEASRERSTADSGSRAAPTRDVRARASSAPVDGDLEGARDALVESLERFARRAAETDDPRYARECLQAAREAGEALETLR